MKKLTIIATVGVLLGTGALLLPTEEASAAYIRYGYNILIGGYSCLPEYCPGGWCCVV